MANAPAQSVDQNILPVQAYFNVDGSFNTFIGQGQPFIVSATESIGIIDVNSINATFYPTFSPVSTGQVTSVDVSSSQLTFNPFTGVFSSRNFAGNLNGLALSATNLAGGSTYSIPYQSASGVTGFIANGSTGQVLTASAVGAPSWSTPSFSIPITDDTTTNAVRYPLFAAATSGNISTEYTSSTQYQFNPSTGLLAATGFSGSGAALTALNASNLSTGTLPSARVSGSYTSITGVGTITAGTWNGTAIGYAYGGTGLTAAPTNGQLLIGNASGYTLSTLTAGTNITIANAAGGITINSTASGGATITDDTTTNSPRYINFTDVTTGSLSTIYTSSTRLSYNPSTGMLTTTGITATAGSINGTSITVADNVFTLQDNLDPTKQAQFQLSAIGLGVTATYTLPIATGTIPAVNSGNTWTANNNFSAPTNTFGSAATASTTGLASGATTTGNTKTVNVGTGGVSGSTTNITVGSSVSGATSTTTMNGTTNFLDTGFTLQDEADTTKQARFQLSGLTTGTIRTYTLPDTTGTLVTLNTTASYTGVLTFNSANQNFGSSTATGTQQFAYGATVSGATKTVNVGTGGVSGSTTNITVGSAFGTTINLNGVLQLAGSAGTSGQVLTSAGAGVVPTWTTISGSAATITDDTATNAVRYLSFTAATSGSLSTLYTSSTKLKYNPSTGAVTASSIIIAP
jgi:hypothetical protein